MRNYPYIYSQRNSEWGNQRLGTVDGATISQYGCILTCQAMKAGYYGHEITPNALDDVFTQRNLYVQGDLLPDVGIHQVYDDISLIDTKFYSGPADLTYLKQLSADETLTVTIEIDFDHDPNDGIQTHFVELHSFDGQNLHIYDPWYGQEDDFATHYGTDPATTIQKIAVYKGNPTEPGTYVDAETFRRLVANSTANDAVCNELGLSHDAGKDSELAAIRQIKSEKVSAQAESGAKQLTIDNLNKQIPELNSEVATLQTELDAVTQKAGSAAEYIDKYNQLKPLYDQLESNYKTLQQDSADYQTRTNRQVAQLQNTSYLTSKVGAITKEILRRVFHLK